MTSPLHAPLPGLSADRGGARPVTPGAEFQDPENPATEQVMRDIRRKATEVV